MHNTPGTAKYNAHIPIVVVPGEVSLLIETMPQIMAVAPRTSSIIPVTIEDCAVLCDIKCILKFLKSMPSIRIHAELFS